MLKKIRTLFEYSLARKRIAFVAFFIAGSYFYRVYKIIPKDPGYYFLDVKNLKIKKNIVFFSSNGIEYSLTLMKFDIPNKDDQCLNDLLLKIGNFFLKLTRDSKTIDIKILKRTFFNKNFGVVYIDGKNFNQMLEDEFSILEWNSISDFCALI